MSFWVFLDKKFGKTIVMFGTSSLKFTEMQKITKKKKKKKTIFGPKMPYLSILGCNFGIITVIFSASLTLSKCKGSSKIRNPLLWNQKCMI